MKNTLAQGSLGHGLCCLRLGFLEILTEAHPVHVHQNPVDKEPGMGEDRREVESGRLGRSITVCSAIAKGAAP